MSHTEITMYGTTWCSDCKRTKKFFGEQRVHYDFIDIEGDDEGLAIVERANKGKQIIPTLVFGDGSVLVRALQRRAGREARPPDHGHEPVLRPHRRRQRTGRPHRRPLRRPRGHRDAGHRARRYRRTGRRHRAARQLPRLPRGHQRQRVRRPPARAGRALRRRDPAGAGGDHDRSRTAPTSACIPPTASEYRAWAVLLALGSTYRRLGIPGEDDFIGAGVHFCATCDGAFYRDKEVLVIGGGNSAGEESIFLTKFASKVTIATRDTEALGQQGRRREGRRASPDRGHQQRLPGRVQGQRQARDGRPQGHSDRRPDARSHPAGVFVFIGLTPNTRDRARLSSIWMPQASSSPTACSRPASPASSPPATAARAAPSRPPPPPARVPPSPSPSAATSSP